MCQLVFLELAQFVCQLSLPLPLELPGMKLWEQLEVQLLELWVVQVEGVQLQAVLLEELLLEQQEVDWQGILSAAEQLGVQLQEQMDLLRLKLLGLLFLLLHLGELLQSPMPI